MAAFISVLVVLISSETYTHTDNIHLSKNILCDLNWSFFTPSLTAVGKNCLNKMFIMSAHQ